MKELPVEFARSELFELGEDDPVLRRSKSARRRTCGWVEGYESRGSDAPELVLAGFHAGVELVYPHHVVMMGDLAQLGICLRRYTRINSPSLTEAGTRPDQLASDLPCGPNWLSLRAGL